MARLADSKWRTSRLAILCYHGVSLDDEHCWNPRLFVRPSFLRQRFELLHRRGYSVLPLAEAIERLYAGELPPRSVAITFDDGLYSFYAHARPALADYGFPATVYLTTFYCDLQLPVFPITCSYLLWKGRSERLHLKRLTATDRILSLGSRRARQTALQVLGTFAASEQLSAIQKHDLLITLATELGIDFQSLLARRMFTLMGTAEVSDLRSQGVDVQLHTHRHRVPLDERTFQREIDDNRTRLAALTNKTAVHFCYPSGVHDPRFLPWLRERGILSATTCENGLGAPTTNPLLLPRILDHSFLTHIEFESMLSGVGMFR